MHPIWQLPWKKPPLTQVELKKYTSFHSSGCAQGLVYLSSFAEVKQCLLALKAANIVWLPLGKGSNTLFTDQGLEGLILQLAGDLARLQPGKSAVVAGAGLSNFKFARQMQQQGLSGAEFLATIPGTVGGSIFMNAGAHGRSMADILLWVDWADTQGSVQRLFASECGFGYRRSTFMQQPGLILQACFKLNPKNPQDIENTTLQYIQHRQATQPIRQPTWGSVFKNPKSTGLSAAQLIEKCGLKGQGFGQVQISPMHANFIENLGSATFEDVLATINLARQKVKQHFNICLELEVRVVDQHGQIIVN